MLRAAFAIFALSGVLATPVAAQPLPDGWAQNSDGSYIHHDSGVVCPKTVGTYTFVRLDGAAPPGTLGVCVYTGRDVRVGEIRVRKFTGDKTDAVLMSHGNQASPGVGLSPSNHLAGVTTLGPGPEIEGSPSYQVVITTARNGLLVDCISQSKPGNTEMNYGISNFMHICAGPAH